MKCLISGLLVLLGIVGCSSDDSERPPPGSGNPPPPAISAQPADQSVTAGAAATFSVAASGDISGYRWQSSADAGASWSDVAGAVASSYTISATTLADDGLRLRVLVSGAGISVTSSAARLTVAAPVPSGVAPQIVTQPADVTVMAGTGATFSVTASGTDLTYQWHARSEGWFAIDGATSATLNTANFPSLSLDSGNRIRVVVSNSYGSVTSNEATVTVTPAPSGPGGPTGPSLPAGCPGAQCVVPVPGATGLFPKIANPLDVTPTLGANVGVTFRGWRKIQGGGVVRDDQSWQVELAPGVTATVTMPWATFFEDVELRLSPVSTIAGLPFTELTGALSVVNADAQELGEALAEDPYTVTFTLTDAAAAAAMAASQSLFLADADGGNLHLVPVVTSNASLTSISVKLDQLGIVGLVNTSDGERQAALAHWPEEVADQFAAAQAEPARLARLAALAPAAAASAKAPGRLLKTQIVRAQAAADFSQAMLDTVLSYYNDRVAPAVSAAYADHLLIADAIEELTHWSRMVQLAGLTEEPSVAPQHDRVMITIANLTELAAEDLRNACRDSGGGFERVRQMLTMMRRLALLGMDDKLAELQAELNSCFRFRIEFRHDADDELRYDDDYGGGYFNRYDRVLTVRQNGSGILQGDAWAFLSTVTGGNPEGPIGLSLGYNFSEQAEQYNATFVGDPVYGVVPVRDKLQKICADQQPEVLGAKIKNFGLVRYPGGRRAVRVWFMDWGAARVHCDELRTRDITVGASTLHSESAHATDVDYIAVANTMLPFPGIQGVPGEFQTWEITLKPEAGGFKWSDRQSNDTGVHSKEESFEITLRNEM